MSENTDLGKAIDRVIDLYNALGEGDKLGLYVGEFAMSYYPGNLWYVGVGNRSRGVLLSEGESAEARARTDRHR